MMSRKLLRNHAHSDRYRSGEDRRPLSVTVNVRSAVEDRGGTNPRNLELGRHKDANFSG